MMPCHHLCLHEEHNNGQGGMAASLIIHLFQMIPLPYNFYFIFLGFLSLKFGLLSEKAT